MQTYIFTAPASTATFQAANLEQAQTIAQNLVIAFACPRELCRLNLAPEQRPRPKVSDPQGPYVNIPIMLGGLWFTPNGQRIHNHRIGQRKGAE